MRAHRRFCFAVWLPLMIAVAACGSSSTTVTSPASADRCAITLNTGGTSVPAAGGSGTVGVAATRECAWSATVEGGWLSIRSGASGQGEGTVEFTAASNPDPQARSGAIVVNGSRAQVTQAAGECVITLASASAAFSPAGGATQIDVRASSAQCAWTASADAAWITITGGGNGRGNGAVAISVAATTGPPRTGSVTVAGQQFSVTQSQGCAYSIDRTAFNTSSAGGSGTLAITTAAACPWTASSNVEWISLVPGAGSGSGVVTFSVAASQGPQRIGTAVIAGHLFSVTQSPGCDYDVQPTSQSVSASGGSGTVVVTTSPGCAWSASSQDPWITIQGATSDVGSGRIIFNVAETAGPARSGRLTVAGRQVTVTQGQGCTTTLSPTRLDVDDDGGQRSFDVQTSSGCAWTASTSTPWISITSGANGSGNGTVRFTVAANNGPGRSGSITAGGQTFTVSQGTGCSVSLSTDRLDVPASGGSGTVNVLAGAGCGWTASSNTKDWLAITSGANGSGNGEVSFTAAANTGAARQGTLTIAGHTFTVSQAGVCSYTIDPTTTTIAASGGQVEVGVSSGGGCTWTAESTASWIVVTMGATGNNNGRVRLTVEANGGAARSGVVVIAGHNFTVGQETGCTFAVSPESVQGVPAAGGTARVDVTASAGCTWGATSNVDWITLPQNAGGSGNGGFDLTIAANTDSQSREGVVTVAGRSVTVSQQGAAAPPPCVITLTPTSQTIALTGGTGTIAVAAGAGCTWSAVASAEWIRLTAPASGSGDGTIQFSVDAAPEARTGTISVGGQVFTVHQQ